MSSRSSEVQLVDSITLILLTKLSLSAALCFGIWELPVAKACCQLTATALLAIQTMNRFRFGSFEFIFLGAALLYNYQFAIDWHITQEERWGAYGGTPTAFPENLVGIANLFVFQLFYIYLARFPSFYTPVPKASGNALASISIAAAALTLGTIAAHFREISIVEYLDLNKIEKANFSPPYFDYTIFATALIYLFSLYRRKLDRLLWFVVVMTIVIAVGFNILSGQRELPVLALLVFALTLNNKHFRISTVKTCIGGFLLFAFLVYLKDVYPYISYYFLGKDTKWTIDPLDYAHSLLLQGEFSANFVLFYKYIDLLRLESLTTFSLEQYFTSFLPFSSGPLQEYQSVGTQVKGYLNVWSGLASGPYLFPYATGGFIGLFLSYLGSFFLVEVVRTIFYRSKMLPTQLTIVTILPFVLFFWHRNEISFLFKKAYLAFFDMAVVFMIAALIYLVFLIGSAWRTER